MLETYSGHICIIRKGRRGDAEVLDNMWDLYLKPICYQDHRHWRSSEMMLSSKVW